MKEYHTYEILPEAIAVSQYHFPFVVHHGDLYEADFNQFKGFDLLLAGTCCQSLSKIRIEDKQVNNGLDGKSGIFFKAIECLRAIQPKYFMFENVIPSREEDLNTMTKCIGVDPLLVDSANFSAQSLLDKSTTRMVNQFIFTIQELLKQEVKHFQELQNQWQINGQKIGENKIMTIRFIKDVIFKDQNNDSVKIKDGKILTAKVATNKDGKEVYEIKQKKNVFTIPSAMKDVVFVVL